MGKRRHALVGNAGSTYMNAKVGLPTALFSPSALVGFLKFLQELRSIIFQDM